MGEGLTTVAVGILVIGALLALLGSAASNANRDRARQATRLAAIDRKLDAIIAHLGVTVREEEQPELVHLLQNGKKIQAIKVYRERTGADLASAKHAVEELGRRYGL
jgi:ribosomal protein L7/L12